MFAYCRQCKSYDSGDKDTVEELCEKVKADGGSLKSGSDVCPVCGAVDSLKID